jgi:hypothetical protein
MASVSHLAPTQLGLDVHKDTCRWRSWPQIVTARTSTGFLMTRLRCPGSLATWAIPACCEPATRPARPAWSWLATMHGGPGPDAGC